MALERCWLRDRGVRDRQSQGPAKTFQRTCVSGAAFVMTGRPIDLLKANALR